MGSVQGSDGHQRGTSRRQVRHPRHRHIRRFGSVAAIVVGAFALTSCSAETTDQWKRLGLPESVTEESPLIGNLWLGAWIAALVVGALVWGLIIWAVVAYRRRSDELPKQTRFNMPIEFLYTVTPLIVIAVLFFFTAKNQEEILDPSKSPDLTVDVIGQQWSWTFNYLDSDVYDVGTTVDTPTLYLPVNQTVRFELNSPDVIHSFWIPSFYMKMDVVPGEKNAFQVTPSKVGSYAGKCAELCGAYHSSMLFNVEVVSAEEFQNHMEDLRAEGQTGKIDAPIRGAYSERPLSEAGSNQ